MDSDTDGAVCQLVNLNDATGDLIKTVGNIVKNDSLKLKKLACIQICLQSTPQTGIASDGRAGIVGNLKSEANKGICR